MKQNPPLDSKPGVSKVKLAVGAASLFLFIVGLKRSFRMDDAPGGRSIVDEGEPDEPAGPRGR